MTSASVSPYAKFSAALLAETILEDKQPDLVDVLARYLEIHGFASEYQLKADLLWGADATADFIGAKTKTVFTWVEGGRFPHAKLGNGGICARKSIIICYIFCQELAALRGQKMKRAR